jgi:hypothetical protein
LNKKNRQSNYLKKDEKSFNNSIMNSKPIDYSAFKRLMVYDLFANNTLIESGFLGHYKFEDIEYALQHPHKYWRVLLSASETLMKISPHYYRLNNYYSNMALFCWGVDLYDVKESVNIESLRKAYSTLSVKLENMNLKHEFSKIFKTLPYQDVFCGLVVENQTDFFIQQVNFSICKLYKLQDGLYNFAIDLTKIKPQNLGSYPDYVQQIWLDFRDGKVSEHWYLPPSDKQICIKLNSQWIYPYPMLINLVRDILDLDLYKKLKLQSAKTDNYKAIMMEVPIDKNTVDKPMITPETLSIFAEINRNSMPNDIGLIHTLGSEGKAISFKDSNNTRNNVSDALDEVYNSSGISQELYNGSSSGTAVNLSVENDSGFVYGVYRQFERWINRFIKIRKYNKNNFKFNFYLLDTTIFNRDNVIKKYKEACTLGINVIDKFLASLDMTPARTLNAYTLHTDIFDFQNRFIPLSSSYNSSSDEAGRPTNASKGETLDIAGQQTEDNDSNIDR